VEASVGLSLDEYDFQLPESQIAQYPAERRSESRLLVWEAGGYAHRRFGDLADLLRPGDLLVLNDTRVFAARLFGRKSGGEAEVEVLLVQPGADGWEALVRPGRRLPPGTRVELDGAAELVIGAPVAQGLRHVEFEAGFDVLAHCSRHGHVPLPPYIRRGDEAIDRERYQTVFARDEGSVAAPTAGLHFDDALLDAVAARGVGIARVTLHVGPGTFRPVDTDQLSAGELHPEWREVPRETLQALGECRARSGRIIAVGTTVCRTLESIPDGVTDRVVGPTRLMIAPGFRFRYTDVLVTNFHLPRSSLLLLVAALAGDRWRDAYEVALAQAYRFYSYGDANWIEVDR